MAGTSRSVSGTLASVTTGTVIPIHRGEFNLSLYGTWTGTVKLQRSFDGGSTYLDIRTDTISVEAGLNEAEDNTLYRLNMTIYGSGTLSYRIGQVAMASYR